MYVYDACLYMYVLGAASVCLCLCLRVCII